eukprot:6213478-Pleurochrysis_carterae.AAC.1
MPLVGGADLNGTASGDPTDLPFNHPYRASPTGLTLPAPTSVEVHAVSVTKFPCRCLLSLGRDYMLTLNRNCPLEIYGLCVVEPKNTSWGAMYQNSPLKMYGCSYQKQRAAMESITTHSIGFEQMAVDAYAQF